MFNERTKNYGLDSDDRIIHIYQGAMVSWWLYFSLRGIGFHICLLLHFFERVRPLVSPESGHLTQSSMAPKRI